MNAKIFSRLMKFWLKQKMRSYLIDRARSTGSHLLAPERQRCMPALGGLSLYQQINRPYPGLSFESFLDGLIAFSEEYQGNLWIEVMLVKDLNDTEDQLSKIASALNRIKPDEVHIMQPTRPPVETWVKPPSEDSLRRASAILGNTARVILPASGSYDLGGAKTLVEAVVGIVTRHPMREDELVETLKKLAAGFLERFTFLLSSRCGQPIKRKKRWTKKSAQEKS
jgi:hypothetical protein